MKQGRDYKMEKKEKQVAGLCYAQMVQQLRETKAKEDVDDAQLGQSDGMAWARSTADVRELQVMAKVGDAFRDPSQLGNEPGLALAEALEKTLNEQFGEEASWEDIFIDIVLLYVGLSNSAAYVAAFVTAAMEVWEEAKAQLAG